MKKKFLVLLVATLLISVLSACGSSSSSSSNSNEGTDEQQKVEKVVFSMVSFNRIPDDYSAVTKAINDITIPKIGVEIDLQIFSPADYSQKVNLALQSGEKLDIFTTLGQFANYASKNQLLALEDLLDKHGKDLIAKLEEDFGPGLLDSTTINGHIYGIPVNKGMSLPTNFVYSEVLLNSLGYKKEDITSINDLTPIFADVKERYPDITPFGPINVNPSDTNLLHYLKGQYQIDFLTDTNGIGVVVGDSGKVVNLYETDEFKEAAGVIREWFTAGYLQKDAATTAVPFSEMIGSGRGFSMLGGYSGKEAAKALSAQVGTPMEMQRIAPYYFDTNAVNLVSWLVNSTTDVPEGAVKFLNLLYTDEQVINTILYGIEDVDYVRVGERHIKFPEGKDANTVSYTAMLSTGMVGSESLQYQLEGVDLADLQLKLDENKTTPRSPYLGFVFDQSDVKVQVSSVTNVVNQYLPGFMTGSLDLETALPAFIKALNEAGAEKIIESKQEQLDKWISEQKK